MVKKSIVRLIRLIEGGTMESMGATAAQLEQARNLLAELVLDQWRREIAVRQLDDPAPQNVRWRLTELDLLDHAKNVLSSNPLSFFLLGWGRLRFSGTPDRAGQMVERFRKLDPPRLAIVGEPGMGKTTLAVLLLRELLEHAEPGDAVPVLFTMSGWNPEEQGFRSWLVSRLDETYPALRAVGSGPGTAEMLVSGRHVLPVLDGLDELAEPVRAKAIAALNAELTPADQLILTCRTDEYASAVAARAGDALAGAAAIEPVPLKVAEVQHYLDGYLPPGRAGWPHLFTQLKAEPAGVLAQALSTPLTLWLLRKVYVDGHREPSGLCDPDAFPTAEAITEHLLDHLVGAVVSSTAGSRRWSVANAERWLGFLAYRLDADGDYDYLVPRSTLLPADLGSRIGRRLPFRLTGFLEDMHRLGLLRRVGPAYQFRHAKLQDRLAAAYRAGRIE